MNCSGASAAVLPYKGGALSPGGAEGSVCGSGHLHWDPRFSAQPSPRHASGWYDTRRFSAGWFAGIHNRNIFPADGETSLWFCLATSWNCYVMCWSLGGQCRPCVPAGASTAGVFSVASHPRRGNVAHTSSALDGPTDQSRIFSQRTQLLGQVITTHFFMSVLNQTHV